MTTRRSAEADATTASNIPSSLGREDRVTALPEEDERIADGGSTRTEARTEPRTEARTEPRTEPRTDARTEARTEAESGTDAAGGRGDAPLLGQVDSLRARWESVQVGFVDDPRGAVAQADRLVTEVLDELKKRFDSQRGELDDLWDDGRDPSTDELRRAFQWHRAFFERLLTV